MSAVQASLRCAASSILIQLSAFGEGQDFVYRFGDRGEDEFDGDPVTITQRLLMMNGKMIEEHTKVDPIFNAGTRIANFVKDDKEAIDMIYLSVLNRYPTYEEQEHFSKHLAGTVGNERARAVADIAWAMLNATEFS